jgi:hypothetical protein
MKESEVNHPILLSTFCFNRSLNITRSNPMMLSWGLWGCRQHMACRKSRLGGIDATLSQAPSLSPWPTPHPLPPPNRGRRRPRIDAPESRRLVPEQHDPMSIASPTIGAATTHARPTVATSPSPDRACWAGTTGRPPASLGSEMWVLPPL